MALISCPECHREISDRSQQCIHCGFPLSEIENMVSSKEQDKQNAYVCLIDGVQYDLSDIAPILFSLPVGELDKPEDHKKLSEAWCMIRERVNGLTRFASLAIVNEIRNSRMVPRTIDSKQYVLEPKQDDNLVHCPRCDSTQIVTGQRGYSLMWGFLGSNKTMNRCASCGYKWEPRKW